MDSTLRQPYNIFPAIRRLKDEGDTLSPDERRRLMTAIALNAADRRAVALAVDLNGDDFAGIYPPGPKKPEITTEGAINTFLEKYGHSSQSEDAMLERLIFNPVPEYGTAMMAEEKRAVPEPAPDDSDIEGLASLAASINETPAPRPAPVQAAKVTPSPEPKRRSEPPMTLELAKIFIKQGRFDRAHEIISKISLNNPEKSVYFADQLRFLEKLIKIQQMQNARKSGAN